MLPERPLVLFPGGMRPEKGFVETCAVAGRLKAELGRDARVMVRAYEAPNVAKAMLAARDTLLATDVEIVSEDLDDAAFARFMNDADLLVLPYKVEAFRERTSGLLIDAMLLARPVVVLEGTWLADLAEEGGFGIVAADNPDAILAAIRTALGRHAELSQAAARYRETYRSTESWGRLLQTIVEPARPCTTAPRPAPDPRTIVIVGASFHAERQPFAPGTHVMSVSTGYRRLRAVGLEADYYLNLSAAADEAGNVAEDIRGLMASHRTRRAMVRKRLLADQSLPGSAILITLEDSRKAAPLMAEGAISTLDQAVRWAATLGYRKVRLAGVQLPEPNSEADTNWRATQERITGLGVTVLQS
jgi:hypothetical protein